MRKRKMKYDNNEYRAVGADVDPAALESETPAECGHSGETQTTVRPRVNDKR